MPDKHEVGGSSPLGPTNEQKFVIWRKLQTIYNGGVAQLGEHLPCKQGVMGSNPIISTSRIHFALCTLNSALASLRLAQMFIENRIKKKETKQIVVY